MLGEPLDKRNFRKGMLARGILIETSEYGRSGKHRPAKTYRVSDPFRVDILN